MDPCHLDSLRCQVPSPESPQQAQDTEQLVVYNPGPNLFLFIPIFSPVESIEPPEGSPAMICASVL